VAGAGSSAGTIVAVEPMVSAGAGGSPSIADGTAMTVSEREDCTELYLPAALGVKVTESVCVPAASTSPAAGVYSKLPSTSAVAFS